jgi:hypothetical protein
MKRIIIDQVALLRPAEGRPVALHCLVFAVGQWARPRRSSPSRPTPSTRGGRFLRRHGNPDKLKAASGRLPAGEASDNFRQIWLCVPPDSRGPRLHDMRPGFASKALCRRGLLARSGPFTPHVMT